MTYVWEHSAQKGTLLLLLLAVADFADKDGKAYPSIRTLANRIRMSPRNTQRAVIALVASTELAVRSEDGPHGTNIYQVIINETLPLFGVEGGGDNLSHANLSGDKKQGRGVTPRVLGGDTAMSPEPSLTVSREPSTPGATRLRKGKTTIPADFTVSDAVRTWATEHGYEPYIEHHLAHFTDYAKSNGKLYADWDGAFRNCIRSDWGGIRAALVRQGVKPRQKASELFCQDEASPGEVCGLAGVPRGGGAIRCDHHELKHQERTRAPMPPHVRAALDKFKPKAMT